MTAGARITPEAILPLDLIRSHTKTDDVVAVTDGQLSLYRDVALEACERYTGQGWRGAEYVEQPVDAPANLRRPSYKVRLRREALDGVITIITSSGNRVINAGRGAREVVIPVMFTALDASMCCGGCNNGANFGARARYLAGPDCAEKIPPGIRLGMLKYIAWLIENPGDRLVTLVDMNSRRGGVLQGTNDGIWGSGALDMWRPYRTDIAS